jgi:hypothetical protein
VYTRVSVSLCLCTCVCVSHTRTNPLPSPLSLSRTHTHTHTGESLHSAPEPEEVGERLREVGHYHSACKKRTASNQWENSSNISTSTSASNIVHSADVSAASINPQPDASVGGSVSVSSDASTVPLVLKGVSVGASAGDTDNDTNTNTSTSTNIESVLDGKKAPSTLAPPPLPQELAHYRVARRLEQELCLPVPPTATTAAATAEGGEEKGER